MPVNISKYLTVGYAAHHPLIRNFSVPIQQHRNATSAFGKNKTTRKTKRKQVQYLLKTSEYLGKGDAIDRAVTNLAVAYADRYFSSTINFHVNTLEPPRMRLNKGLLLIRFPKLPEGIKGVREKGQPQ